MRVIIVMILLMSLISCGKQAESNLVDGVDGVSCYSESVEGGVNIICGDEVNFVSNGNDGSNGVNGTDGQNGVDGSDGTFQGYLEYVVVCEDTPGQYQETLLYLDGEYMAFLSSSNHRRQRMVILKENTLYKTTDGRNLSFSIINGQIDCSLNQ